MSRVKNLTRSLPAICRAVTGQKGIKLVFRGPPRTDGKTIYTNPIPMDADDRQVTIITGDIDHECGHILYSDFNEAARLYEKVDKKRRAFMQGMHNGIEDIFIERREGEEFIGCRENLRLSVEYFAEDHGDNMVQPCKPGDALAHYVESWGRVNVLGHSVKKVMDGYAAQVDEILGKNGRMRVDALLSQHMFSVDSTRETFQLAVKVARLLDDLADEADKADKPKDEGTSDQQQSGDQSQSGASSDSDNQQQSGDQGDSNQPGSSHDNDGNDTSDTGNDPQKDGPVNQGQGAGLGGKIRAAMESDQPAKPLIDRSGAAEQAKAEALQNSDSNFLVTESMESASEAGLSTPDRGAYQQLADSVRDHTHELQRRIVAEYQTLTRRREKTTEDGRLDSNRLHRALLGDRRIYRRKTMREAPFPAVSLVIDCSGSMAGQAITLAKQAMIVLAEVNEQINVKTELMAFAGTRATLIKPFEQGLQATHGIIGALGPGGGTPTATALWHSAIRLNSRREQRKLLLLVTDGQPNDLPAAQAVAKKVMNSNIELYGIGIGAKGVAVKRFCPKYAVLTQPKKIPEAILQAFRSQLMQAA